MGRRGSIRPEEGNKAGEEGNKAGEEGNKAGGEGNMSRRLTTFEGFHMSVLNFFYNRWICQKWSAGLKLSITSDVTIC